MDLGLQGKVALVCGASAGIGFAIAKELVREGASVILASRSQENLNRATESLRKEFPKSEVFSTTLDFLVEERIRTSVSKLVSSHELDIVVNNVGGPTAGNTLELPLGDWDRGYQALLRSSIQLAQLVIPPMEKRGWGRFLTVTSTTAKEILPGLPISSTFRSGLTAWTKYLAKEIGRKGVLINNLLPGMTHTERLSELNQKNPTFLETRKGMIALGRFAEPAEIGRVATFLCSDANTYITGTDILADGGYTIAL